MNLAIISDIKNKSSFKIPKVLARAICLLDVAYISTKPFLPKKL